MSPLEITAVIASLLAIWLTAKRWMLCWPINLLACALYFALFLKVKLYADMVLQGLFAASILYGWVAWRRGQDHTGAVIIRPIAPSEAFGGLIAGALGGAVIGSLTSRFTDASLPWMDAMLSSFSLVAQLWTARRHVASWLLWIAVDSIYVGMFVFKGLMLTAGLYAAMIMIAVAGYRRWARAVL